MKTCFLFPGQGAQYPGMARDLWEESPAVRQLFQRASEAAEMDVRKLLFESSAEELKATDKTQVAITVASLSSSAALREKGVTKEGCAGFSLGEFAALHEAGVIELGDLFPIVKVRGALMEKAARALDDGTGAPGMMAVIGLPTEKVVSVLGSLENTEKNTEVYVSNHNSPSQVVISGTAEGLAKAESALKAAGAKRMVRLSVSGPFHSPLMADARKAFDEALSSYVFSDPKIPVYSNVTGAAIRTGEEARELCGAQIVSRVSWVKVQESLFADGFDRFLETGPGSVLAGLLRALRPGAVCSPAGRMEDIRELTGGRSCC